MKSLLLPYLALTRFAGQVRAAPKWIEPDPTRYGFQVGSLGFLIAPKLLSEVVLEPEIYPIPNTASWLKGMINLRGNVVPVYDLAVLFERTQSVGKPTVLVLDEVDKALAVMIDHLPKAVNLTQPVNELPELPASVQAYIAQGYYDHNQIWLELNHIPFFRSLTAQIAI